MISKAEFLDKVKKEFSKKDEYKSVDVKKRLKKIKRDIVVCVFGALLVLFLALSDGAPIGEALCLVIFIVIFLMVTELKKLPPSFAFLKNSDLCKPFWVKTEPTQEEIDENSHFLNQYVKPIWSRKGTKDEYLQRFNSFKEKFPDNPDELESNHYFIYRSSLFENVDCPKLIQILFDKNIKSLKPIVRGDFVISLEKDGANFSQMQIIKQGTENQWGKVTYFSGILIKIKLKRVYKDPVVFLRRKHFNKRKGFEKVQLHHQDLYFDVFSNDTSAAQNLCLQGLSAKLLRLNNSFNFDKIEAAFLDNDLFIAIHTKKDLFKGMAKSPLDIHQYELFYDKVAQLETYCAQFRGL